MAWQPFVAAAVAPAIVWVLWRLQSVAVDVVLRGGMFRLLRSHRILYNSVSWVGVLLHELAHATFLVLGGHGIKGFAVGVDAGHVTPRRTVRGPYGHYTLLLAALAPLFIGPALILAVLVLHLDQGLVHPAEGTGLAGVGMVLEHTARTFTEDLLRGLIGLDLATPGGAAVFLLAVLATPSARPSHGKGEARGQGDVAVLRSRIRREPWPFLVLVALVYASYFVLAQSWPQLYWGAFQWIWATAITGIVLAILGGIGWWAVGHGSRIAGYAAWVPWTLALAAQVAPRAWPDAFPGALDPAWMNLASMALFVAATLALAIATPRRRLP